MAIAFYRRYRPKTLGELVGQEHISETLKNAARTDRISHAYLFYGPRGSGKTTTARILAKILNCEKRFADQEFKKTGEPCNQCKACLDIDAGRALDVIEIDAASNRGIDEIRALKEAIKMSPALLFSKIYIIDEVHQLTKEAFNALLKTLEEPPKHAVFILATTDYDKLPSTIVSRVQRYGFKKVPINKIIEKLSLIAKEEKINISTEALALIAEMAEGGFRDAESLFEQVASMEDSEITIEEVEKIFGKAGFRKIADIAGKIIENDFPGALKSLSDIDSEGYNLTQLAKDVIKYLRRVLVLSYDPSMADLFKDELTGEALSIIKSHALKCDKERVLKLLKELIGAYQDMKYSPFPIIPFETAIMEIANAKK